MEEDETVVLISSTDFARLKYIKRILEDNNIPYVYNSGFCSRHNSHLVEENDEFFSEDAQIIDIPDELKDIDEDYFKEQENKNIKRKQKENTISKITIYGIFIFTAILLLLIAFEII